MFVLNNIDKEKLKEFSTMSIITGVLMALAGILAIANPLAGSVAFVVFLGALFISGAIIQGYITFKAHQKSLGAWFKVFLLFVTGVLLLIWPGSGIAAVAILFAAYFFMDAFASFGMALDLRPLKGWGLAAFNGMLSLLLGIIMLIGWPFNAAFTVGIIVGVSFLMDGLVLIYLGWLSKKGLHD
ncbi:HdeD family acid-resistance protein [Nautilia lithotrophica]